LLFRLQLYQNDAALCGSGSATLLRGRFFKELEPVCICAPVAIHLGLIEKTTLVCIFNTYRRVKRIWSKPLYNIPIHINNNVKLIYQKKKYISIFSVGATFLHDASFAIPESESLDPLILV
jgi:hypothetical protein